MKLKVSDQYESAIYRYWTVKTRETGFCAWVWIKGSSKLKQLSKKIDDLPDMPPGPEDPWTFEIGPDGSYYLARSLNEADLQELRLRLDELISYYITLMREVGGVKRFLV